MYTSRLIVRCVAILILLYMLCLNIDHPTILNISKSGWRLRDSPVTLHCLADGNPPPVYSWIWKRRNITQSTAGMVVQQNGRSLLVKRVTDRYSGRFTCSASNSVGSRTNIVRIRVMGKMKTRHAVS